MTADFIKWAGRQLRPWQERIEAHQRRERFARLLRVDPKLRAAHERRMRSQRMHDATAKDLREMQEQLHAMLRREVGY